MCGIIVQMFSTERSNRYPFEHRNAATLKLDVSIVISSLLHSFYL